MGYLSSFSRMVNPVTAGLKGAMEPIRAQASYARSRFCSWRGDFRQTRSKMSSSKNAGSFWSVTASADGHEKAGNDKLFNHQGFDPADIGVVSTGVQVKFFI